MDNVQRINMPAICVPVLLIKGLKRMRKERRPSGRMCHALRDVLESAKIACWRVESRKRRNGRATTHPTTVLLFRSADFLVLLIIIVMKASAPLCSCLACVSFPLYFFIPRLCLSPLPTFTLHFSRSLINFSHPLFHALINFPSITHTYTYPQAFCDQSKFSPCFLLTLLYQTKENVRKCFESHRKRAPQVESRIGQNERSRAQI